MQRGWYELDRSNTGVIFYLVFPLQICFYDICSALLVHKTHSKGGKQACIRRKNLPFFWVWNWFNDSEDIMSSPCISLEKESCLHATGRQKFGFNQ